MEFLGLDISLDLFTLISYFSNMKNLSINFPDNFNSNDLRVSLQEIMDEIYLCKLSAYKTIQKTKGDKNVDWVIRDYPLE